MDHIKITQSLLTPSWVEVHFSQMPRGAVAIRDSNDREGTRQKMMLTVGGTNSALVGHIHMLNVLSLEGMFAAQVALHVFPNAEIWYTNSRPGAIMSVRIPNNLYMRGGAKDQMLELALELNEHWPTAEITVEPVHVILAPCFN